MENVNNKKRFKLKIAIFSTAVAFPLILLIARLFDKSTGEFGNIYTFSLTMLLTPFMFLIYPFYFISLTIKYFRNKALESLDKITFYYLFIFYVISIAYILYR
ncbi:MAG: hypothetical protein ACD_67C00153G0001 [uncultured bacterium]|nr:MAG: hypothetical protein ACD_67C00153G0001 [uncultured bacterium]